MHGTDGPVRLAGVPMAKPAGSKAATRRRILDAAVGEFAERGLERARMAVVGRRAGVANGTVYWHFATKPRLYRAVVERVAEDFYADVAAFAGVPGTSFMDVADRMLSYLDAHPDVAAVLAFLRGDHPVQEVRESMRTVDGLAVELWRRWMAQAAGGPVRGNLARLVAAGFAGVLALRVVDDAMDVRAVLSELGTMVESAIGTQDVAADVRLQAAD